jgi:DNA adenine methylase
MVSNPQFTTVQPVRPVAPYLGGKRNLAKRLVARIQDVPHDSYCEPFVGMAGVFLRRTERPRAEVINDLNKDVANFFRVLQRHYIAFLDMIRFQLTVRAEFERLVATDPATLTDLERAARFLYLQRNAFGGKVAGQSFGVSADRPGRFDLAKLGPMLEDLHSRLSGVVIECLPWDQFVRRYDRSSTLFYLDPPYWGGEDDYGKGMFARADYERMAEELQGMTGRFILSINDVPEIREVFGNFHIETVKTTYTVSKASKTPAQELIVSNVR